MNTYYAKQYKEIRKMQTPVKKLTILSDCDDLNALLETLNNYKTSNLTTREKETWEKLIKIVEKNINTNNTKDRNKFKIEQDNYKAAKKEQRLKEKEEKRNLKLSEKEEKIKMKELESNSEEKKVETKQDVPVVAKSSTKLVSKNEKNAKIASKKK